MSLKKKYIYFTIVLSVIVLGLYYKNIILHPNGHLFNANGDGIKNYYTFAYHVKNDKGLVQFGGMRYPTFEQITYTDGQPLLSGIVKVIFKIIPVDAKYSIGIMNLLMLFSIVVCAVFLFLILNELGVNGLYASISATSIAFLSPQVLRFTAHYALSYCFVIPATWYFILLLRKYEYRSKFALLIAAYNLGLYFIHPYLGISATLFILLDLLFNIILYPKGQTKSKLAKHILILILPLAIFKSFTFATDHHIGRPESPMGLFIYNANPSGVFLPYYSVVQPNLNLFLKKIGIIVEPVGDEGHAYIGIATTLVLIIVSIILLALPVFKLLKKPIPGFYKIFNRQVVSWMLIGICFLFLSFAYPFKWNPDIIYKFFPTFKQFRGLGRFAWSFYYTSTIFAIYVSYKFFEILSIHKNRKSVFSYILLIPLPVSYFLEAIPIHQFAKSGMQNQNLFDERQLDDSFFDALHHIDRTKYQAILPLPYYDIGSETYIREPEKTGTMLVSQLISYHEKLPIIGGATSRTSLAEAINSIQIIAPSFYPKPIFDHFLDERKILLTVSKDNPLTENEQNIFNQGKLIYDCSSFSLLEIPFNQLKYNSTKIVLDDYISIKSKLFQKGDFLVSDSNFPIYFNDFENKDCGRTFFGKGAYSNPKKNFNVLTEFGPNTFKANDEYVVSLWLYSKGENTPHTFICAEEFNPTDQKGNWNYYTDGRFAEVIQNDWSLVEFKFKTSDSNNLIKVFVKGQDYYTDELFVDNLLIRKVGVNVYKEIYNKKGEKFLFLNNHLLRF
jgi:hypothetical protein